MIRSFHTIRQMAAIATALSMAAFAVPEALAGGGSSSGPGMVASALGSPDSHDRALRTSSDPGLVAGRIGSPDPTDAARVVLVPANLVAGTLGSPDPRDPAVPTQVVRVVTGGFDWGDFGIGVAAAVMAMLILSAGARQTRQVRHRFGGA
jgi:hypothetical protein